MTFRQDLYDTIHREPDRPIVEYKGRTFSKGEYAALADRTVALLDTAQIDRRLSVGVIVRNRVMHAAAMLGLIAHDRWLTSIYAMQSAQAIAEEIRESRFAAIIADAADWTDPVLEACRAVGAVGIVLDHGPLQAGGAPSIHFAPGLAKGGAGPFREVAGEPGLEILSSGTTGKPKRVVFPTRILVRAVESVMAGHTGAVEPDVLVWPYGGIGGMCALVAGAMLDRYTCILEKFNVADWVDGIRRLRPSAVSGVPAMARMILDARVPKDDIASIRYFYGGSAPMTPALQTEFEETYGIAVIWAYGATEFCGTVISWSPALHAVFGKSKLGAMGRALPGIGLRIADVKTGAELGTGETGYLEVRVPAIGDDWIRTTDLALIDADGFVFHKGRGDGAILRGGFKVLPEVVVEALRSHPAVLDAAVVGLPDARLGAVPVAAVELKAGASAPSEAALRDHVRRDLAQPQVPARVLVLDALPRTPSMKVDLTSLGRIIAEAT
jgi:acyl-CoA synthetase (AMP-forming)/AMP-acid ligase II